MHIIYITCIYSNCHLVTSWPTLSYCPGDSFTQPGSITMLYLYLTQGSLETS